MAKPSGRANDRANGKKDKPNDKANGQANDKLNQADFTEVINWPKLGLSSFISD